MEVAGAGTAEVGLQQQLEAFQQKTGIPVKRWVSSCAPVRLALLAAEPCVQDDECL